MSFSPNNLLVASDIILNEDPPVESTQSDDNSSSVGQLKSSVEQPTHNNFWILSG